MTLQDCNQWLYLIIVSGDAGDDFRGWHHRGSFINDKDKNKEIGQLWKMQCCQQMIWKLLWVNIPSGVVALKVSRMDRRKLTLSLVHNRSSRMNHRVHVVCVRKVEALIKAGREEFTQHFSFFSICVSCCVTICKNRGWWFNFIQNLMAFFSLQGSLPLDFTPCNQSDHGRL